MSNIATYTAFPDDYINPKEKNEKWGLQVAQAIWSSWNRGSGVCWGKDKQSQFLTNILYSNGQQNIMQYANIISPPPKKQSADSRNRGVDNLKDPNGVNNRKNLAFLAKGIVSPMPKLKELMLGTLEEIDHEVFADSVDEISLSKKMRKKHEMWVKSRMMPALKKMESQVGIPAPKMSFQPNEWADLEMYEMTGGFKLALEIGLEQLGRSILRYSEWKKVARQFRESLWDNGLMTGRVEADPYDNQIRIKYIPITRCILGDPGEDVKAPIPYGGHLEKMSLRDVENRLVAQGTSDVKIRSLVSVALKNDYNNWAKGQDVEQLVRLNGQGEYGYHSLMMDVFCFEYISSDRTYNTLRKNQEGEEVYHEDEYGSKKDSDKRKTVIIDKTVVYEGIWIVGTETMMQFGKAVNQVRPDMNRTRITYFFQELKGLSKVERCIPHVDGLQLSYMKLQAAKAAAAPKGLAIEINSLSNIKLGDGASTPLELIKIRTETGTQLYRSFQLHGGQNKVTGNPISELEGGIGKQLKEWSLDMGNELMRVFEITGFNDVSAASPDQSPEKGMAVSYIAMAQTNNAMKPLYEALTSMKQDAVNVAVRKAVTCMSFDDLVKETYENIIGKPSVEAVLETLKIPLNQLGIKMVARPNQEMINDIRMKMDKALEVGRNGVPSITMADAFVINGMLEQGKAKEAEMYLVYQANEGERKNAEQAAENSRQQGQILNENEALKHQNALELQNAKTQGKLAEIEAEKQKDLALTEAEKLAKIEMMQAEGNIEASTGTNVRNGN